MSKDLNRKNKRPKQKTLATSNPATSVLSAITKYNNTINNSLGVGLSSVIAFQASRIRKQDSETRPPKPVCPLLAKDSEWVDILQGNTLAPTQSTANKSDEEEVLQLVDCEDGPHMKPLAIMFPGLLEEDPQTVQGIHNKTMSTSEVTKHLVDLGQTANFTFMKKANRLISPEKQWLESVPETSNSLNSVNSQLPNDRQLHNERSKGNDYDNA